MKPWRTEQKRMLPYTNPHPTHNNLPVVYDRDSNKPRVIYPAKTDSRGQKEPFSPGKAILKTYKWWFMYNLKWGTRKIRKGKPKKRVPFYAPGYKRRIGFKKPSYLTYPGGGKGRGINARSLTSISGEITTTNYVCGKPTDSKYDKMFRESQQFTLNEVYSSQHSSATGKQNIDGISYASMSDLYDISGFIVGQQKGATAYNYASKFGLKTVEVMTTYSNSGNSNLVIEIYEIEPKRDQMSTQNNVLQLGASCCNATWVDQAYPGSVPTNPVVTTLDNSSYGVTPFQNQAFVNLFSVKKIFTITLAPGSSHVHKSTYHINRAIPGAIVHSYLYGNMVDINKQQLVISYGMPVHDSTTTSAVTVGPTRYDVVIEEKFICHDFVASNNVTVFDNSLPTVATPEQWTVNSPVDTTINVST